MKSLIGAVHPTQEQQTLTAIDVTIGGGWSWLTRWLGRRHWGRAAASCNKTRPAPWELKRRIGKAGRLPLRKPRGARRVALAHPQKTERF